MGIIYGKNGWGKFKRKIYDKIKVKSTINYLRTYCNENYWVVQRAHMFNSIT